MSKVPANLKYVKTHEWLEFASDGTVRVGISDHAQDLLGDMVFVELPEVGRTLRSGQECGVVESVKAASDVYSPLAGTIIEINTRLAENPELVNKDPYAAGWMFKLRPTADAPAGLLDAAAYSALIAAESH